MIFRCCSIELALERVGSRVPAFSLVFFFLGGVSGLAISEESFLVSGGVLCAHRESDFLHHFLLAVLAARVHFLRFFV